MAKHIHTEIEINAPAEVVWNILTDFANIATWNDFIRHIEGGTKVGDRLVVEIWLGERKPQTFKPKLLAYEPNRELRWRGRFLVPGLFDGEHSFTIEPLADDRCRFVHSERFSGVLIPLVFKRMQAEVNASFTAMNRALKARAEAAVNRS